MKTKFNNMMIKIKLVLLAAILLAVCGCEETKTTEDKPRIDFRECVTPGSNSTFEVVTFNLKEFPYEGDKTILYASELIQQMDADVVAIQEISSERELNKLADACPGWSALFSPVSSWSMSLGYLYKSSEVEVEASATEVLFQDDTYNFPRGPLKVKMKHVRASEWTYLINLHLKCCSGSQNESRRRNAALKLKAYMDDHLANDQVILLGDFNDRISGDNEYNNVFWCFIEDSEKYQFADMTIATGSDEFWSYPSYPSHIDHILISNEYFDQVNQVYTTRPDACVTEFHSVVSDHRPVIVVLTP
jgi:endonuclease/exonuclease/phosphatase family metal-dependent hydrolase